MPTARDLSERLFAAYYPFVAAKSEAAGLRETRAELLAAARGRTLEIGAGDGINLPHYPAAVTELVLSEPSRHMLPKLRRTVARQPPRPGGIAIAPAGVEALPFPDAAFDTVVCTLVLCSVPDPRRALSEIARVLAPGGELLFLEHVRAPAGTVLGHVQDLLERPHRALAAGCHPNRATGEIITSSPLEVVWLRHWHQPRSAPTVRPAIVGSARRPGEIDD